ncbi:hypothetical protein Hypma_012794 [Hypsizygus marmoreus]|uniref:Uncharacterized protein n=1 Tax=Hypsizygus marmoreus TaxID=39966 RepID=A0A369JD29_HYPMA|nr:hypothetical protein Hypma_012794 [Hypsizygus marmoreus]
MSQILTMDIQNLLIPEDPRTSTVRTSNEATPIQHPRTLSHGGELSQPMAHYRSLRSSSARTASDHGIPNSRTHTPRTTSAVPPAPLSRGTSRVSTASRSQKPGPAVSSSPSTRSAISETESQISTQPPRKKHIRRGLSDRRNVSLLPPRYRASLLLWHAHQYIDQVAGLLGRRPCIMDVILDLKLEYDEDTLIEILQRRRDKLPLCRQYLYAVKDEQSLNTYWADQAAIWRGVWAIDEGPSTRFPDSDERSTATWTGALNGGPCDG